MDWLVKLIYISFFIYGISGQSWDDPFIADPNNEHVELTENAGIFTIKMDEGVDNLEIGVLEYTGAADKITIEKANDPSNQLDLVAKCTGGEKCLLIVNNEMDFEGNIQFTYKVKIVIGGVDKTLLINVVNVDDNTTYMQLVEGTDGCKLDEESGGETSCKYTLNDADGDLGKTTFRMDAEYEGIFEFRLDNPSVPATEKDTQATLFIKDGVNLQYDQRSLYIFILTLSAETPSTGEFRVLIEIIDIPNKPPVWTQMPTTYQLDENTDWKYEINARDGDLTIEAEINYKIENLDEQWKEFIKIPNPAAGEILVSAIDRDIDYFDTKSDIEFEVVAYEKEAPDEWKTQPAPVTLIINDVDDNKPQITMKEDPNLFRICERSTVLPTLDILIDDIDMGENARYTVSLEENEYTKAFSIVPENGYKKLPFLLTVQDSNLLDYENQAWKQISFKINAVGTLNEGQTDSKQMTYELINWNDEIPIFEPSSNYEVDIDETIEARKPVAKVLATDKDGGIITYSIPEGMRSILEITDTGEIITLVDRAFDYERQNVLQLYVTATDAFTDDQGNCNPRPDPLNSVTATVNINIIDINDETPILTVIIIEDILITENRPNGETLDLKQNEIHATDADASSVLDFSIDWGDSRATKYGSRLTDENFEAHVKDFLKIETRVSEVDPNIYIADFKIADKYPENTGNTPDYEKFDNVVLRLRVTDTKQEDLENARNYATADITIRIEDENDNAPAFDMNTINQDRRVIENAIDKTTLLGRILATDPDGPEFNEVLYKLEELGDPGTPSKAITIDPKTGELYVINGSPPTTNIDCDEGEGIDYLRYNVIAFDDENNMSVKQEIKIGIIDINDISPQLSVNSETISIEEETIVIITDANIKATDGDRDAPHNTIRYSIKGEWSTSFEINQDNGELKVIAANIDREKLSTNPISLTIVATDNLGNDGSNSDEKIISIKIEDKNDNKPDIQTKQLTVPEDKTGSIGDIKIEDLDEPENDNSKVNLEILSVTHNNDPLEDYFAVSDPIQNIQITTFTLKALKDLKSKYGQIDILLKATDNGPNPLESESTLKLTVNKVNFKEPIFTFPEDNKNKYYLGFNWVGSNTPAIFLQDDSPVSIIAESDQGAQKYQVELKVLTEDSDEEHDIFSFLGGNTAISPRALVIKSQPREDVEYMVKFRAANKDGDDYADPDLPHERVVTFEFKNREFQPTFVDNEDEKEIEENDPDFVIKDLPEASYDVNFDLNIYYYIRNHQDYPFRIKDNKIPHITLDTDNYLEGLDRETDGKQFVIQIIASRYDNEVSVPSPDSILTLTINIKDINDNNPEFEHDMYYFPLINTFTPGVKVGQVVATDLDEDDTLKYKIESQVGLDGAEGQLTPFKIDDDTQGIILLNFAVTKDMVGYFVLEISATDTLQGIGNTKKTNVEIYIVSDLHRVDFKFVNTLDEVNNLQTEILEILSKTFSIDGDTYECVFQSSHFQTDEEGEEDNLAVVSVHFIDINANKPVLKTTIIDKASQISIIAKLTGEFNNIGLALKSFVENFILPEDLSEFYKTWLIGVSVTLGVLLLFLILAFTFKYMGMRKQISRLTDRKFGSMDSGLNRIPVPNANKKAYDGANPMFASNEKTEMPPDNISVSSGDSELYGVENNPVFSSNVEKF